MQRGTLYVKVFPSKSEVSQLGSCLCWGAVHTSMTSMSGGDSHDPRKCHPNLTQRVHSPVSLLFSPSPLASPQAPTVAQPLLEAILHFGVAKVRGKQSLFWAVKRKRHEPI